MSEAELLEGAVRASVAPMSVSRVMSVIQTRSRTTEYGPTRRPRTTSLRTMRKSAALYRR